AVFIENERGNVTSRSLSEERGVAVRRRNRPLAQPRLKYKPLGDDLLRGLFLFSNPSTHALSQPHRISLSTMAAWRSDNAAGPPSDQLGNHLYFVRFCRFWRAFSSLPFFSRLVQLNHEHFRRWLAWIRFQRQHLLSGLPERP